MAARLELTLLWYRPLCFCHVKTPVSIITTWFTQQKQRGLYQNKVTSSLAAIQWQGHWSDNRKMVYPTSEMFILKASKWPTEPFTVRKKFTILSSQSTGCLTTSIRKRFNALFLASMNSLLAENEGTRILVSHYSYPEFRTKTLLMLQ